MKKALRTVGKEAVLFLFGGGLYALIEMAWRGHTHWTMAVLGGLMFLIVGGLNNWIPWEIPLIAQAVAGAAVITVAEFIAGCILNLWLGLGIWDYSRMPGNILGQICPAFSLAWIGLSVFAIVADDWLRFFLWGEQRPTYKLF